MNLDRLVNMIVNQVVRRVVNLVVDRGFSLATRKAPPPTPDAPPAAKHVTTPEELALDASLRAQADRAAKAAKMARRLGR